MIGKVYGRQPRIEVTFVLPNKQRLGIEFVVDTGFDGYLMLPVSADAALGLSFLNRLDANLADDRRQSASVHGATIMWDEQEVELQVLAMGKRPLLGTLLMDGHRLVIPFRDGEAVTVELL